MLPRFLSFSLYCLLVLSCFKTLRLVCFCSLSTLLALQLNTFRAVHSGGGGGQRGQLPPPEKLNFFSNIVFKVAELFLVSILVRNHKKIN